jgi:hypothetical protein
MDHLHVAITWTCVVWETVACIDGPKHMDPNKLSRFKYNLFVILVGMLLICLGHLLNVGSGLFMNLLNEVSTLTSINVNTLLHR